MSDVSIRQAQSGDLENIRRFILEVFNEFVGPLYPEQGRREFDQYCHTERLRKRMEDDHRLFVAEEVGRIVGAVELRHCAHICLFYVDARHQGRGVGTRLLREAVNHCIREGNTPQTLTVNASPNSVAAYAHMGFAKQGEENIVDGIRFLPMSVDVPRLMPRR